MKNITLDSSLALLSNVWNEITPFTLRKVWKPLLGKMAEDIDENSTLSTSADVDKDATLVRETLENVMPKVEPYLELEIFEWLTRDDADFGWQQQSVDEIVAVLTQENKENFQSVGYEHMFDDGDRSSYYSDVNCKEECDEHSTIINNPSDVDVPITIPNPLSEDVSATQALEAIKIVQQWFKQENNLRALDTLSTFENKIQECLDPLE